jgi:hypothetical protein
METRLKTEGKNSIFKKREPVGLVVLTADLTDSDGWMGDMMSFLV